MAKKKEMTQREFSRKGGKSRSPRKLRAVRKTIKIAREAKREKA